MLYCWPAEYFSLKCTSITLELQCNFVVQCSRCHRLVSGALQLAEGTHLTIDETQLQTGTLNSTGVDNARVLKSLTELQKVH